MANFDKVTESALKGKGLFDVLMRSTKEHLNEEYVKNRIKGSDYSKVYIGAMESVMAQTVQYLSATMLEEEQRAQILAQTEISKAELDRIQQLTPLEVQKLKSEIHRLDLLTPLEAEQLQINVDKARFELDQLMPLQLEKHRLEVARFQLEKERLEFERDQLWALEKERMELEKDKLAAEVTLISTQKTLMSAQADLAKQQAAKIKAEIPMISEQIAKMKQEVILAQKQVEKMDKELVVMDKQIEKMEKELDIADKQIEKMEQEVLLAQEQINKMLAEIALIEAKTESEILNAGVDGLVANQVKLLKAQISGFTDDFNAKIYKTESDMWVVSRSTNPEAVAAAPLPGKPTKT